MVSAEILKEANYGSSSNMNAPPSEMLPHVLRLSITGGCSYNKCTFCNLYKGVPYQSFSLEHYVKIIDRTFKKLNKQDPDKMNEMTRVFIGDGNALNLDARVLCGVMERVITNFRHYVGRSPRRITLYGTTSDILEKGRAELKFLKCGGTCSDGCFDTKYNTRGLTLLYWGVESGSTDVLEYVRKGVTKEDVIRAGDLLERVEIAKSVMIMPGLGGVRLAKQHTKDTIEVLNKLRPRFVSLLPITPSDRTAYFRIMQGEIENGTNRPLTDRELAEQIKAIVSNLDFDTVITSIGEETNPVIKNPFAFSGFEIDDFYLEEMRIQIDSMFREKFQ